jgi:hypothetical protein
MANEPPPDLNEKAVKPTTAIGTNHGAGEHDMPAPEVVLTTPPVGHSEPESIVISMPNPPGDVDLEHGLRARQHQPPDPFSHWQSDLSARWVDEPEGNWYDRSWAWVDAKIATLGAATRRNKLYRRLWPWLQEGLVSRRMWKNWVRVMLIMFVSSLMMVIQPGECEALEWVWLSTDV